MNTGVILRFPKIQGPHYNLKITHCSWPQMKNFWIPILFSFSRSTNFVSCTFSFELWFANYFKISKIPLKGWNSNCIGLKCKAPLLNQHMSFSVPIFISNYLWGLYLNWILTSFIIYLIFGIKGIFLNSNSILSLLFKLYKNFPFSLMCYFIVQITIGLF